MAEPVYCGDAGSVYFQADVNQDCEVSLKDLARLDPWGDFSHDDENHLDDFLNIVEMWLECSDPCVLRCGTFAEILARKERSDVDLWLSQHFTSRHPQPGFSFFYDGVSSVSSLDTWQFQRTQEILDAHRIQWTLIYTDQTTGLVVTCKATKYNEYPAVEWVVYFENTGTSSTPILSNIQAANFDIISRQAGDFVLYHADDRNVAPSDYQPHTTVLTPGMIKNLTPHVVSWGTPESTSVLPYFNLQSPDNGGVILGVGWSGQWAASFQRDSGPKVNFQAGMELTNLSLYPGEKIRTPAILLVFWSGPDRLRGHNQLRSLLLNHYAPVPTMAVPDGLPVAGSIHGTYGFEASTEANVKSFTTTLYNSHLPVDYVWIDAGWYDLNGTGSWVNVGTWEPDPVRYPNGMQPVADWVHLLGFKFLVWFEPERVMPGSWLYNNHPEWLLAPANLPSGVAYQTDWRLFDYGNPDALAWAKTKFSGMIDQLGIDIYRNDFNMHPLFYWRNGEAADRQGAHEIHHIMGLYDYYDTLRNENPNLLIDHSAGPARPIFEFEMIRRTIVLWRSDGAHCWDPDAQQSINYGLSLWVPITGHGAISVDPYDFRSGLGSFYSVAYNAADPSVWAPAHNLLSLHMPLRYLFQGDFYPLTPYSLADDTWIAWQYHRADRDEGVIQAFRRVACTSSQITLLLKGLDSGAIYTLTNLDEPNPTTAGGNQLMTQGFSISLAAPRSSAIITYKKN